MRQFVSGRGVWLSAAAAPLVALLLGCGSGVNSADDGSAQRDAGPGATLTVTTDNLPAGMVDVKYHAVLAATGGLRPLSWRVSEGSLPPGLSLNPASGSIDGTPSQEGQYAITVEATDAFSPPQIDTEQLTLRIQPRPGPVSVTTTTLPDGQVGVAYAATLAAAGGAQPYAWVVESGTLPAGLRLNLFNGELSGTPSTYGISNFVVRVNDSLTPSQSATQPLSINVQPPPPVAIDTATLPNGLVGEAYFGALAASGGLPPYHFYVQIGALPAGLSLPASGLDGGILAIIGTPTATGVTTFTLRAYDSFTPPGHADKQLSITVTLPPQQDAGVQNDAAIQTDAAQTDAGVQNDAAVQTDAAQTDAGVQNDAAVQTDAAQTDANQSDVMEDVIPQTDVNDDV